VLVIDDEEAFCRATGRVLEQCGCRVRQAGGGKQGLELVHNETPDLNPA